MTSYQTSLTHEPGDAVVPARHPGMIELCLHSQGAVRPPAQLMNLHDLRRQLGVGASRGLANACPVPTRGDTQHPIHPDDRVGGLLPFHKLVYLSPDRVGLLCEEGRGFFQDLSLFAQIRFSLRSRRSSSCSSLVSPS